MTVEMFLMLLASLSVLSGTVTEGVKNFIIDKENISYNILALSISVVIGGGGTVIYYILSDLQFTLVNIVYAFLMACAVGLVSMIGYDKLQQTILQMGIKK